MKYLSDRSSSNEAKTATTASMKKEPPSAEEIERSYPPEATLQSATQGEKQRKSLKQQRSVSEGVLQLGVRQSWDLSRHKDEDSLVESKHGNPLTWSTDIALMEKKSAGRREVPSVSEGQWERDDDGSQRRSKHGKLSTGTCTCGSKNIAF